jgi:hypothetical protein
MEGKDRRNRERNTMALRKELSAYAEIPQQLTCKLTPFKD